MSEPGDEAQTYMTAAYEVFRRRGDWKTRFSDEALDGRQIAVTLLGEFHYQVENGGPGQWWDNGYAHAVGAGGRSAAEALQAVCAMHAEADPEVADAFGLIAHAVAGMKDPRKASHGSWDEDGEDFDPFADLRELTDAFATFGQPRRFAFLDAVARRHDPALDPFTVTIPAASPDLSRTRARRHGSAYVELVGQDGNAFAMIARTRIALRRRGVSPEEIERFTEEAKSGDYHDVIETIGRWVSTDIHHAPRM